MGASPSKRLAGTFHASPDFTSACDAVFSDLLDLSQHSVPGVFFYQLPDASIRLHPLLSASTPLVRRWVPAPPSRSQVDRAFRSLRREDGIQTLGSEEFRAFAAELFTDAVVDGVRKALVTRVPIGVAGIAGIGLATKSGKDLVGAALGVYALGVAGAVYLSLLG